MKNYYPLIVLILISTSCREELEIIPPEVVIVKPDTTVADTSYKAKRLVGFYLLNEGNMGSNKSTLDYYNIVTGEYHRNIYADINPTVPKELGDVGNDIGIYGNKLYAVINCSNKIEVMEKNTAKRLGQINIPNCRYIKFHDKYAYISSYAGPVEINPNYEQTGYIAKVDTSTFQIISKCLVGFQPDEIEIVENKIYVANSGGYMVPNYEKTVSVIDINSFCEIKRINVAINLHRLEADKHGNIWVSSRGDYYNVPSKLYWIDTKTDICGGSIDIPVSDMTIDGDSLYLYSTEFSYNSMDWTVTYGIIDVAEKRIVTRNFISDKTEKEITMPYGIAVNPVTKDIYLTDAANFVYPGAVICFDKKGKKKWQVRAGDIPGHFAFLFK